MSLFTALLKPRIKKVGQLWLCRSTAYERGARGCWGGMVPVEVAAFGRTPADAYRAWMLEEERRFESVMARHHRRRGGLFKELRGTA